MINLAGLEDAINPHGDVAPARCRVPFTKWASTLAGCERKSRCMR